MYTQSAARRRLRSRLLRWYARSGRELPWRRTRDAYAVLVSEVMLQQTGVGRVLPAYGRFLGRFPTAASLARAPLGAVLRAWAGLGYNRRARDLWRAARAAGSRLPAERAALDALPGVGRYTAGAVACFAYDAPEAFADTNVRRVLGRVMLGAPATIRVAEAIDAEVMPRADPARWHHALMDVGATICLARAPRCADCPLAPECVALARGTAAVTPPPRRQAAFATSDRRVRGAIVDALRAAPAGLGASSLARRVPDPRVARLVADLAREGLVERSRGRWRLPG